MGNATSVMRILMHQGSYKGSQGGDKKQEIPLSNVATINVIRANRIHAGQSIVSCIREAPVGSVFQPTKDGYTTRQGFCFASEIGRLVIHALILRVNLGLGRFSERFERMQGEYA